MQNKAEFQNELFEEIAKPVKKKHVQKNQSIAKQYRLFLNVSYEQLVFCVIALIMVMVLVFSLGVEKGKTIITAGREEESVVKEIAISHEVNNEKVVETEQTLNKKGVAATPPEAKTVPQKRIALEKAPLPPKALKKVSKPYTIQVATYWSKSNAKKELESLKQKGMNSFIISTNGKYEVCVGEYINKDDAKNSIAKLKKYYKDCFLRRR